MLNINIHLIFLEYIAEHKKTGTSRLNESGNQSEINLWRFNLM